MPLVSVILPVYNGEKYIREAVQSILSQTFRDFTLYVIDDGSTDNTLAILNEYADDRLRIIKNGENKKLIYTLNKGLQLSIAGNYTYLVRMDADDISLPQRIEKQVAFMEANPEIGLCGSWVEEFNEKGTIKISERAAQHEQIISELFFQNTIWHPSVILRTEVIGKNNLEYEARFVHAEDYALWCRMAQLTQLANVQEVLLKYRIHNTKVSVLHNEEQRKTCVAINHLCLQDMLYNHANTLNKNEKEQLAKQYVRLLHTIPVNAKRVTKEDIYLFRRLIDINAQTGLYKDAFFKKSLADFVLQYWSLWCPHYSVKMFTLLFVQGRFFSKYWPWKRQLITAGKCFCGWKARK